MDTDPSPGPEVERFRALVIGRANCGKTTILKAICGSEIDPRVSARDVLKLNARPIPSQVVPSTDVRSGYLLHPVLIRPHSVESTTLVMNWSSPATNVSYFMIQQGSRPGQYRKLKQ
jgi:GTPase SAR1 family protein